MKKFLMFIISLCLALCCLFSCSVGDGTGDSNGDGGSSDSSGNSGGSDNGSSDSSGGVGENGSGSSDSSDVSGDTSSSDSDSTQGDSQSGIVYSDKISCTVITDSSAGNKNITNLVNGIGAVSGSYPAVKATDTDEAAHEIIVGRSSRRISEKAYRLLGRMETEADLMVRFLIYAEEGSVAIAYDGDTALKYAINYFVDELATGNTLTLRNGTVTATEVSLLKAAKDERASVRSADFAIIAEEHGQDVADSLEAFYSCFSEELYIWLANLWDPTVGGFYYSSSGRDTLGYLPDIESTSQAMNILENTGLLDEYGGKYENAIPEWMKEAMLNFAKGLQDPDDGFFYHPQWGKNVTVSRRGRDLGWATAIITALGGIPYYDAPNGVEGEFEGNTAVSMPLTRRIAEGKALAASRVVSTASTLVPSYLRTPDAIEEYIRGLDIESDSYSKGNTLASLHSQIKAAGPEVIDRMFEVLAELQYAETGGWEKEVTYNTANGIMKISSLYNHFSEPYPNADAAFETVLTICKDLEGAEHVCSVYNPWVSMDVLLENIKKFGDVLTVKAYKEQLVSEAASLIDITMQKLFPCCRDDGGFSYYHGYTNYRSQGALVALPNTKESDVNATSVAIGTVNYICDVLGIEKPGIFCAADYDCFLETLTSMGEIVKNEMADAEPITFDDGYISDNITNKVAVNGKYQTFEIVDDPAPAAPYETDEGETVYDKALRIDTMKDADGNVAATSSYTALSLWNVAGAGDCYVLDTDIYYESTDATSNTMTQIFFTGAKHSFALSVNAYTKGSEKKIRITEHCTSGTKDVLVTGLDFGKWYNLRVEYYKANSLGLIYLDGELVAEADLHWVENEKSEIRQCKLLHYRSVASRLYIDNVIFEKIDKSLGGSDGDGTDNGDTATPEFGTLDGTATAKGYTTFESGDPSADNIEIAVDSPDINDKIKFSKVLDVTSSALGTANNAMRIETFAGYTDYAASSFIMHNPEYDKAGEGEGYAYTFEADMYVDPSTVNGWFAQMFIGNSAGTAYSISFRVIDHTDGKRYVRITRNSLNTDRSAIIADGFIPMGEWFNLKLVFYYGSSADSIATRYYINGLYAAEDLTYRSAALADGEPLNTAKFTVYSRDDKTLLYFDNLAFTAVQEALPEAPEIELLPEENTTPAGPATFEEGDPCAENATVPTGGTVVSDSVTEKLGEGNSALKVATSTTVSSFVLDPTSSSANVGIEKASYTFETKLYISSGISKSKTPINISFIDSNAATNYQATIVTSKDGKISIRSNVASKEYFIGTLDNGAFDFDTWVNLKIILYKVYDPSGNADRTNAGVKITVTGIDDPTLFVEGNTNGQVQVSGNSEIATNGVYAAATNGYDIESVKITWNSSLAGKVVYIDDPQLYETLDDSFGEIAAQE